MNINDCFTKEELHSLMCKLSQTEWEKKHTPWAVKVYTSDNTYISEAGNPHYKQIKG